MFGNRGECRRSHKTHSARSGQELKIQFEGIFADEYRSETIR